MTDPRPRSITRRQAIQYTGATTALLLGAGPLASLGFGATRRASQSNPLKISLAQWSLHKLLYAGELNHLDFAAEARKMGFAAVEYVNSFFKDKATDAAFLKEMNTRAADADVKQLLIMCDGEGNLGDADEAARTRAIENHRKWLDAAKELGCHSIRVNAASSGTWDEQRDRAADGLRRLADLAEPLDLFVLVENHGGLSSNGKWLAEVMRTADHPRVGTLPDFGNFCMDWSRSDQPDAWYDRYQGVTELMPFAKAVSAKSHDFDTDGNETKTDYERMLRIVRETGYSGWIGVEYEGGGLAPREGSLATKKLIERVWAKLDAEKKTND
ncbi:MAG: sugar phosphate isomerase/epimerase family protein [Phycisphaerales bacterium JB050]